MRVLTEHLQREPQPGVHDPNTDNLRNRLSQNEWTFRHSGWSAKREKIHAAMIRAGVSEKVIERFEACGSFARPGWSEEQKRWVIVASYCKSRFCEPCGRSKQMTMAANLRRQLEARPIGRYRFTTITIAHTNDPLPDQLKKLQTCWKKLRASKLWRSQKGGAYFIECKIGEDDLWHPHIHLLTEGYFLPQRLLSDLWSKLTGGSYVVDVRPVRNIDDVCMELTKYVCKGTSSNVWDDVDRGIEWICASRGVRMCGTFGTWRKFALTQPLEHTGKLIIVGTLTEIFDGAARGISKYLHLLWCIQNSRPPPEEYLTFAPHPDKDGPCENPTPVPSGLLEHFRASSKSEARGNFTKNPALPDQLFNASSHRTPNQPPGHWTK